MPKLFELKKAVKVKAAMRTNRLNDEMFSEGEDELAPQHSLERSVQEAIEYENNSQ